MPACIAASLAASGALAAGCGGGSGGNGAPGDGGESSDGEGADAATDSGPPATDASMGDAGADVTTSDSNAADTGVADTSVADTTAADTNVPEAGPPAIGQLTMGGFTAIFDAVPDPAGATIYFTGIDTAGDDGVFSVAVGTGTQTPKLVSSGTFVAPFGIAISSDGKTLYVADLGTNQGTDLGGLYSVSTSGGAGAAISGGAGVEPRGLTVAVSGGTDTIYFTGRDATTGAAGVFSIGAGGGTPTTIAEGAPFVDPSGITVAANGDIYVSDTVAAGGQLAAILEVSGGAVTSFASGLTVGYPTGIALVESGASVLLSGIDPLTRLDTVNAYSLATMTPTPYVAGGVGTIHNAAGLHRAAKANTFAFVDSSGDGTDAVYVIQ